MRVNLCLTSSPALVEMIGAKYLSAETHSLEDLARAIGDIDLIYEATGAPRLAFDITKFSDPTASLSLPGFLAGEAQSKSIRI